MSWNHRSRRVAYFSMEIALDPRMPTYAGGLGVLAGDMLRSCADLGEDIVGVTLVHRHGYFRQVLAADGGQTEAPAPWRPEDFARRRDETVTVEVQGRPVQLTLWQFDVVGSSGHVVPVILLDADRPENSASDRALTDELYGDGPDYRIGQEIVLGIGGVRALRALGQNALETFHLNEGHAAFATLELLREQRAATGGWEPDAVRQRCIFTTHTPVPAGHDQFDYGLVDDALRAHTPHDVIAEFAGRDRLNMTSLALTLSHYVNGVARAHRDVSEHMFPGHPIGNITNGVHSATWTSEPFRSPVRSPPARLARRPRAAAAGAGDRPRPHLARARRGKDRAASGRRGNVRAQAGSRSAHHRFRAPQHGLQAGRPAVPRPRTAARDRQGQAPDRATPARRTRTTGTASSSFATSWPPATIWAPTIPVVYLPNYDVELAKLVVSGVDLWLNTPLRPLEASGTSGMKAAHNGVPSFSVLDGWWIEGCIEGVTGWAIGQPFDARVDRQSADRDDAADLYRKLETAILPTYTGDRNRWISVMQHAIALNASFFNTHRMVQQYVANAYI